jgi:hypothetical protein
VGDRRHPADDARAGLTACSVDARQRRASAHDNEGAATEAAPFFMPMPLLPIRLGQLAAATVAAALCMACAPLPSTPATSTPGDVVVPNANLVVQGIPPVPASIARAVARYNDFRGHRFVAWHPTQREMLVSHRRAGVAYDKDAL